MRSLTLLALPVAVLAVPLAGQGFEGTLSMKLYADQPMNLEWTIKGTMSMAKANVEVPNMGPMDIKIIIDNTAQTTTVLTPVPAALAQIPQFANTVGFKIVTDMKAQAPARGGAAASPSSITKLGTSQTIAGLRCDDYELGDSLKTRACLTTALGKFVFPGAGGRGGAGGRRGGGGGGAGMLGGMMGAVPTWTGSLNDKGFPLKVWTPDGKVQMEVTDVRAGAVSADSFAIPDGYTDPTSMFGGAAGGAGGAGGAGRGGRGGGGGY